MASYRILNPAIQGDFDITFATHSNLTVAEDMTDLRDYNRTTEWNGSFMTAGDPSVMDTITYGMRAPAVNETEWQACNGTA